MSTVAEQLRQAREAKKLTVYQVSELTKIRTDDIRALDEGNYDVFSAPVYVRGFVRSYATLLGLDLPAIMEALNHELSVSDKHKEPPALVGPRNGALDFIMYQLSKLNWRAVLVLLLVVTVGVTGFSIYRAWVQHQTADPLSDLGTGLYQPAKPAPNDTLPLPPAR